jgi:hypothetical protein
VAAKQSSVASIWSGQVSPFLSLALWRRPVTRRVQCLKVGLTPDTPSGSASSSRLDIGITSTGAGVHRETTRGKGQLGRRRTFVGRTGAMLGLAPRPMVAELRVSR